MKKNLSKTLLALPALLLAATAVLQPVSGQVASDANPARQINQANALVREGNYEEALQEYGQIQTSETARDVLDYNQAVAQFRKGEVDAAESLFASSASSADPAIAADSRYNLGNCLYTRALKSAETDKSAALEQLGQAISHYRGSLRGNPDNADARANIELANEMIRKLTEEQEKQDQQDNKPQNQQNDQSGQGQDEQQNDQQPSDEKQNEEQKKSNNANSDDPTSEENKSGDKQSQPEKDSETGKGQPDDNQTDDAESRSRDNRTPDSATKDSDQPPEQPTPVNPQDSPNGRPKNQGQTGNDPQPSAPQPPSGEDVGEEAKQDNTVPSGELTSASQQKKDGNPDDTVAMADPGAKEGLMTREEALKMLQAVRDRDMLRRLRQEQVERSRHVPVDRDW